MTTNLWIEVSFPAARYHAQEWPPSPARLFQALLAGIMTGGNRRWADEVRPALAWLETLQPPEIFATPAATLRAYRLAVPNNDMDKVAEAWLREQADSANRIRTMKPVRPKALPADHSPHVSYCWQIGPGNKDDLHLHFAALQRAARCLHTLGWGTDMAWAEARTGTSQSVPGGERWKPTQFGEIDLMVPVPGFLEDLEATYRRFLARIQTHTVNPDTRPTCYGIQAYERAGRQRRLYQAFALVAVERGPGSVDRPYSRSSEDCALVAAWLRHAAHRQAIGRIDEETRNQYILGHTADSSPETRRQRISYIPLPSIGHLKSDGRIRRVLLLAPPGDDPHRFRRAAVPLSGEELTAEGGGAVCRLAPLTQLDSVLQRYVAESQEWTTVTPIILHGHNTSRGAISLAKTEKLLRQAFGEAGYPAEDMEILAFQAAPFWPNTPPVHRLRTPAHLQRWPRYHVAVRFRIPVAGPVVVGLGRHYGIGLLAPAGRAAP